MSFSQHGDSIVKLLDGFWDTAAFQFDIIRRPCVFIQQQKVTSLRLEKPLRPPCTVQHSGHSHCFQYAYSVCLWIHNWFFSCTVRLGFCKQQHHTSPVSSSSSAISERLLISADAPSITSFLINVKSSSFARMLSF